MALPVSEDLSLGRLSAESPSHVCEEKEEKKSFGMGCTKGAASFFGVQLHE